MRSRHTLGLALPLAVAVAAVVTAQPAPAPATTASAPDPTAVERGRYLAAVGDCMACHTEPHGARYAGGRPLQTPFGTLLSANLTPDDETGIGRYTADTFYRALHEGIDREGRHLYPAFPYNYYTRVTREDSDALFAYFKSLPPVRHPLDRNQLPFPFNVRGLMTFWNWLFLDEGGFRPDPSRSASWNRGAYLVEGLGHCQACHTPMNRLGSAKRGEAFRGGRFGTWFAPDITPNKHTGLGGWGRDALIEFLREGRNVHTAASTEMGEVVAFSTSRMTEGDLAAVADYLGSLPASPERPATSPPDAAVMRQGEAVWQDTCSACHRMDGRGVPRFFPPLQGDPNVQQSDPTTVLHFILAGTRRVPTAQVPTPLGMPAYDWKLSDDQVAAVATYLRNSWGNAAPAVSTRDVAELRRQLRTDQVHDQPAAASGLGQPGAGTFGKAGTDSRDNGTPQAGRAAPAAAASATSPAGGAGQQRQPEHPSGPPTGGPG
jgi:mono/diheme cytochrome c family protein